MRDTIDEEMFRSRYGDVFKGDVAWQKIDAGKGDTYGWESSSTYVQNPPYFEGMSMEPEAVNDIESARVLSLFKDSITTDHISPAGGIKGDSPAGDYLRGHPGSPGRIQLVWIAPRQSRCYDAGHFCQYPYSQPDVE